MKKSKRKIIVKDKTPLRMKKYVPVARSIFLR